MIPHPYIAASCATLAFCVMVAMWMRDRMKLDGYGLMGLE